MLKIRLFASMRDTAGRAVLEMELPSPGTVAEVFRRLVALHPELESFQGSLLVARNREYTDWEAAVEEGDEVAFFPPVSGGSR